MLRPGERLRLYRSGRGAGSLMQWWSVALRRAVSDMLNSVGRYVLSHKSKHDRTRELVCRLLRSVKKEGNDASYHSPCHYTLNSSLFPAKSRAKNLVGYSTPSAPLFFAPGRSASNGAASPPFSKCSHTLLCNSANASTDSTLKHG
jgi:hypothetical protein